MIKRVVLLALLLALALFACPINPECPLHDGVYGIFTGTKVIDGHLVGIYNCFRGPHKFLVRCD